MPILPLRRQLGVKSWRVDKVPLANNDLRALSTAMDKAEESSSYFRLGAVLYRGKQVIIKSHNAHKSHPLQDFWNKNTESEYDRLLHAEIALLHQATCDPNTDYGLSDCTVAVARLNRAGFGACSYPCKGCFDALARAGIRQFTCFDPHGAAVKYKIKEADNAS